MYSCTNCAASLAWQAVARRRLADACLRGCAYKHQGTSLTLAAATSFIAEVIFLVFFTEPTRSRSSLMDLLMLKHGRVLSFRDKRAHKRPHDQASNTHIWIQYLQTPQDVAAEEMIISNTQESNMCIK